MEWWQGIAGYGNRKIDCIYLTNGIWDGPPPDELRRTIRMASAPNGIQWDRKPELGPADVETWKWWQVRPLSWESAGKNPQL